MSDLFQVLGVALILLSFMAVATTPSWAKKDIDGEVYYMSAVIGDTFEIIELT